MTTRTVTGLYDSHDVAVGGQLLRGRRDGDDDQATRCANQGGNPLMGRWLATRRQGAATPLCMLHGQPDVRGEHMYHHLASCRLFLSEPARTGPGLRI
jgi:hypothetical protein